MAMGPMMDMIPLSDETKPMLIGIMNGNYKEAIRLYVKHFCGRGDAVEAQIVDLDATSVKIKFWSKAGDDEQLSFEESDVSMNYSDTSGASVTVRTVGDCRRTLVEMARVASEALGEEIALPPAPSATAKTPEPEPSRVPGARCLNDLIEPSTLECLNQSGDHPVQNLLNSDEDACLASDPDVDQQLLIRIGFRLPVKVSHMCFFGSSGDETAPQEVKIFQGKPNIGFQEAEEEEPTQALNLTEDNVNDGQPVQLRYVKFQNVSSLQIFVETNFGSDVTKIKRLELYGQPAAALDMKEWSGTGEKAFEKFRKLGNEMEKKMGK